MQIPPFPAKGNSPRCSGRKSWGHLTCQHIPRFPPSRFTCAHPLLTTACHSAAVPAAVVSVWVPDGTTQRASRFSLPEHGSHRDLVIASVGSCRSSVRWPAGPDACWPPACCLFDLFSPVSALHRFQALAPQGLCTCCLRCPTRFPPRMSTCFTLSLTAILG